MWRLWTAGWGPRAWWHWVRREGWPMWVAWHLPARVCYWAFIRVHALGEVDWEFKAVSDTWVHRHSLED